MPKAMHIEEWITRLDEDRSIDTREVYARLKAAKLAIDERLGCAESDGIDLDGLEPSDWEPEG